MARGSPTLYGEHLSTFKDVRLLDFEKPFRQISWGKELVEGDPYRRVSLPTMGYIAVLAVEQTPAARKGGKANLNRKKAGNLERWMQMESAYYSGARYNTEILLQIGHIDDETATKVLHSVAEVQHQTWLTACKKLASFLAELIKAERNSGSPHRPKGSPNIDIVLREQERAVFRQAMLTLTIAERQNRGRVEEAYEEALREFLRLGLVQSKHSESYESPDVSIDWYMDRFRQQIDEIDKKQTA